MASPLVHKGTCSVTSNIIYHENFRGQPLRLAGNPIPVVLQWHQKRYMQAIQAVLQHPTGNLKVVLDFSSDVYKETLVLVTFVLVISHVLI